MKRTRESNRTDSNQPIRGNLGEMFHRSYFADVSLNQWMALTPPKLVQAHLNLDDQTLAALSKEKPVIAG